ncbi:MAG: alpha-mannosidase, partial [Christensenellaceae bacterium]|nr:alpha-mannosidase [Christensenellaceae bacterium]
MFDYLIIGQKIIIGGLLRLPKLGNAITHGTLLRRIGIEAALNKLHARFYNIIAPLSAKAFVSKEPLPFENRFDGKLKELTAHGGGGWAEDTFDCAWLQITGSIPENADKDGKEVVFLVDTAGEGLVYDKNGRAVQGVTCWASQYDYRLGAPLKKVVINDNLSDENGNVDFFIDCGANDLFGKYHYNSVLQELSVATINKEIRALYYDVECLISVYDFNKKDAYTAEVFTVVKKVCDKVKKNITDNQAAELRALIAPYLANKNDGEHTFTYSAIGHSHLDLGWLWPIRETKRKGARTFTNQLLNIERYPHYKFGASQAQLYKWMKDLYPDVYARVKEAHAAGKWEIQGAAWVEPDSNLIGGESIIRQLYYGKRFFQDEFGEEMKILWLPDSFGYSGCIPQIMKLADVPYFLTQKMSWNTVNQFPLHTFRWAGIDGSVVLAHMLPENTYNSPVFGGTLKFGEKNYKERKISDISMSLFGIGDGGGGPGFEHIERAERFKDLKGMPKYDIEFALPFFERLESLDTPKTPYPSYKGELYLERHQGTATTHSKVKKYN